MKEKISIYVAILVTSFAAHGQVHKNRLFGCWQGFDNKINTYADSLNLIRSSDQLPKVLADSLIDWKQHNTFIYCLSNQKERISARAAILDRVYREDVLGWIIESKNKNYDKLYRPAQIKEEFAKGFTDYTFPDLPFMKLSWRELAKKRLDVLKNRREQFK